MCPAPAFQLGARGITVLAGPDEARGLAAERTLRDAGADARFVPLDVTDSKSVRQAAEWIDQEYGRLDILISNAAIARGQLPSATDLDEMREVYETNVFGVIMVTNAMLPLRARPRGSSTCPARCHGRAAGARRCREAGRSPS